MLTWFDERLIQYPKPVAIAWQTSFDQLTAPARQLLQRLAWLAPDPIPESLMEVPVPENDEQIDAFEPLAELESYSLVNRATDRPSFSVHRLVQEVTRRKERDDSVHTALIEAQHWIDASFIGDPQNPDDRPVLNPLLTHVLGVSAYADETGITEPTARLMNQAGRLLDAKAQYAEAEPLYLRALAIREQILEPNHPDVAQSLNDLAELYRTQGVYAQAEPLHQRALAILEQAMGPDHPDVAQSLNDLAELYRTQSVYA
ncbi:MAG: tetratricopeptide repeat protein, partial [Nitrospira sp.]